VLAAPLDATTVSMTLAPADVITSPFTFLATAGTIARAGASPVFCDIDPATFNLSPTAVEAFIVQHCERHGGDLVNKATRGHIKALMPSTYSARLRMWFMCADSHQFALTHRIMVHKLPAFTI
jgi:dTDP-4-amino-4,6-dideoxygalactose transaminase